MPDFTAEVIVAGAGPAGIAAAISAARRGADCLLIEAGELPGGTVIQAGIFSLCGYFPMGNMGHGHSSPLPGAPSMPSIFMGRMRVIPVRPWKFSSMAGKLLDQSANLRVTTGTPLAKGMRLRAKALVDCTGDAVLARLAGAETVKNPPASPGLGFVLHGIDPESLAPGAIDVTRAAARHFPRSSLRLFPDLAFDMKGTVSMPGMLNLSPESVTMPDSRLMLHAYELLDSVVRFLSHGCEAMRHASVCWRGTRVGLRSGRVIKGKSRLEFGSCPQAGQGQVKAYWPSEMWQDAGGAVFRHASAGYIHVPDSCLEADFHVPLFAAGRCISATPEAQASVRVTGTSVKTGMRAGILAAQAAAGGGYHNVRL